MNEPRLYEILRLKRQHGSLGEAAMIAKVLMPYAPVNFSDPAGETLAFYLKVGDDGEIDHGTASKTLFSAHVDTVHARSYAKTAETFTAPTTETVANDIDLDKAVNMVHAKGDVLGADDGAGVWLLLEMIDAGVPGHYMFHRGEECGGVGSTGMVKHYHDFLAKFDRAIAFDRKATHSVITHQHGRCCSDKFAEALSAALSTDTYFFAPDDGGVFTDTANYTDDIGECTNVSVGYYNEHTHNEKLDLAFLFSLRDTCILLDWDALPTVRTAGEIDPADRDWLNYGWGSGFGGTYSGMKQSDFDKEFDHYKKDAKPLDKITADDLYDMDFYQILDMCEDDPYTATNLIMELLYGPDEDQGGGSEDDVDPVGAVDGLPKDIWDNDDDGDFNVIDISRAHLKVGMQ